MFCTTEDVNLILILSNSWPACPELGSGLVLCLLRASCPNPRGGWLAIPGSLKSKGRMMLSTQNDSVTINQSRKPLAQRDIVMEPIWLGDLIPALSRVGSPYLGLWFLCDQNKLWAVAEIETSLAFLNSSLPRAGVGAWLSKPEGWCQDCFIQQRWVRANKHH